MKDALDVAVELPEVVRDLMCRFPGSVYVAGGFVRDVLAEKSWRDVDVWSVDLDAWNEAYAWLSERLGQPEKMVPAPMWVLQPEGRGIELVKAKHGPAEGVIKTFDFIACQAALVLKDGWHILMAHERVAMDIKAGTLFYCGNERSAGSSLRRAFSLTERGWRLPMTQLDAIARKLVRGCFGDEDSNILNQIRQQYTAATGEASYGDPGQATHVLVGHDGIEPDSDDDEVPF